MTYFFPPNLGGIGTDRPAMGKVEGMRGSVNRIDFYRRDDVETGLFEPEAQSAYASENINNRGSGHKFLPSRIRITRRRVKLRESMVLQSRIAPTPASFVLRSLKILTMLTLHLLIFCLQHHDTVYPYRWHGNGTGLSLGSLWLKVLPEEPLD